MVDRWGLQYDQTYGDAYIGSDYEGEYVKYEDYETKDSATWVKVVVSGNS